MSTEMKADTLPDLFNIYRESNIPSRSIVSQQELKPYPNPIENIININNPYEELLFKFYPGFNPLMQHSFDYPKD